MSEVPAKVDDGTLLIAGTQCTLQVWEHVCEVVATGKTVSQAIRDDPNFPNRMNISRWTRADKTVEAMYREARNDGFDAIADECMAICEGQGYWEQDPESDERVFIKPDAIRDKLRIWTRLELLKRWDPKRYGELLKLGDPNGLAMQPAVMQFVGIEPKR